MNFENEVRAGFWICCANWKAAEFSVM
jgi:hypothetical protein